MNETSLFLNYYTDFAEIGADVGEVCPLRNYWCDATELFRPAPIYDWENGSIT